MAGIIGIFVSLALLIYLADRGWNVIFVAPICVTVAILFDWGDLPVLASNTQIYMPAPGSYFAASFPRHDPRRRGRDGPARRPFRARRWEQAKVDPVEDQRCRIRDEPFN